MKILILTSSNNGTAAHHLPYLLESKDCEVKMVILNEGKIQNRKKNYDRRIRKILKIGVLGALNGIRMRPWFRQGLATYKKVSSLETICMENKLPFYKVDSINTPKTKELFVKADADLGLSLGNSYISKKIFNIPKFGMINIHHEQLPEYQNAQSVIWQLYNMSKKTGYTIHKIDSKIDTGEIIFKENVPIHFSSSLSDTIARTSIRLLESSAKGLVYFLEHFDSLYFNAVPQGEGTKYTTPTIWQYFRILRNFKILKNQTINVK